MILPTDRQLAMYKRGKGRTGPEISDLSILPFAFFFVGVDFKGAASFSFFSSLTLTTSLASPRQLNKEGDILAYRERWATFL
jgi:hypothetical protein